MTRGVIDTCSGNSQCIPQFPSVNCFLGTCSVAFEGTDILTMDEIGSRTMPRRFGVVYADFPGKGLVRAVIAANEFRDVLRGQSSGRCADIDGARHANGTVVQLYDCHGNDNQRWTATPAGELRIYDGTKCMDARDGGVVDGTRVQIYDCNGTGAQRWTLNPDGSVVNPRSGRCLDALGDGRTNGTPLALWSCHGGANQRWAMGPHS